MQGHKTLRMCCSSKQRPSGGVPLQICLGTPLRCIMPLHFLGVMQPRHRNASCQCVQAPMVDIPATLRTHRVLQRCACETQSHNKESHVPASANNGRTTPKKLFGQSSCMLTQGELGNDTCQS